MPGPVCLVTRPNPLYWSRGKLEQYLLCSHPSLTKQSKQRGQATRRNPQPGPERRDPRTMGKVTRSERGLIESYVGSLWRQSAGVAAQCVE